MDKSIVQIGVRHISGKAYAAWFKIGNQQFSLSKCYTEDSKLLNRKMAEWYTGCLSQALKSTGLKTDIFTESRLLEIVEKINEWQSDDMRHPLTCHNDSNHKPLVPKIAPSTGQVWLYCTDCEYCQTWIPDIVIYN